MRRWGRRPARLMCHPRACLEDPSAAGARGTSPSPGKPDHDKVVQMSGHKLPDLLAPSLRVVFVGTAAGRESAAKCYYAGRGNRFWRTLHEVGLTPRLYE